MAKGSKSKTKTTSTSSTSAPVRSSAVGANNAGNVASTGHGNINFRVLDGGAIPALRGTVIDVIGLAEQALEDSLTTSSGAIDRAVRFAEQERAETFDFALNAQQPDKELIEKLLVAGAVVAVAWAVMRGAKKA